MSCFTNNNEEDVFFLQQDPVCKRFYIAIPRTPPIIIPVIGDIATNGATGPVGATGATGPVGATGRAGAAGLSNIRLPTGVTCLGLIQGVVAVLTIGNISNALIISGEGFTVVGGGPREFILTLNDPLLINPSVVASANSPNQVFVNRTLIPSNVFRISVTEDLALVSFIATGPCS